MTRRLLGTTILLLSLVCARPAVAAPDPGTYVPEVYRHPDLLIRAGIAPPDGRIVQFGDVLSLVVRVSWNGERVRLEDPDESFFTDAWPQESGPVLLEAAATSGTPAGSFTDQRQFVFRFQIVSCPDGELTCPGNRRYRLPEFVLNYRTDAGERRAATFRPEPQSLMIVTSITRDEEDRLHPFPTYFPTGAYPGPLAVMDGTRASLSTFGLGLVILIGGVLMWPFRFRDKNPFASKQIPRWQQLLRQLPAEGSEDPVRLAEQMRRCLVWYCSDELKLDPFDWLDADGGGQPEAHAPLRELFMELLHDASGRSEELRSRLTALIPRGT